MAKKEKKNHSTFWEVFNITLWGIIWLFGAILGILGMIGRNVGTMTGPAANPLYVAETNFSAWCKLVFKWNISRVDFRVLGAILIAIGLIGLLITFYYFANKIEKRKMVEARRKERLAEIMSEEGINLASNKIAAPKEDKATSQVK